ncbi:MAG: murein biosynthesis integral membrane protein MurJ [Patescibacteria group bacterium]|nr:murein biosynthesis integral membrane protein MurJ [Patescibacteria group bacterium]
MIKALVGNGSKLFSRRQTSIFSAALILASAFGASALLGILRDRLLYARFYSCCADQLDAYNAAFRLPDIIFRLLVTGALSAAFIPVFSEQLVKSKTRAYQTASAVITALFLIFFGLSILLVVFSYPLSDLITSGFSNYQVFLMSQLTKLMVLSQLFFLMSNFLTGILQSFQRFLIPALSPIVYNLGIIFGILFLSPKLGIFGPALGVVIGAALHLLVQLPLSSALGFKYSFLLSFNLPGVRKILRLMLPRTLALGLGEIGETVALFLATSLPAGSLSLFYLAQRLTHFSSRIFGTTIGQASLPVLSKEVGAKRFDLFRQTLLSSLLQAAYFAFPAAALLLVLRVPIVRIAYGAEKFPWKATVATGRVVAFFAPLVVFNTINDILIRGFYALQDTKTPLFVSLFSLVVNTGIALYTTFILGFGTSGLALAITVAGFSQMSILMLIMIGRIKIEGLINDLFLPLFKMLFAGILSGAVAWFLLKGLDQRFLDTSRIVGLAVLFGLSIFGGSLSYFLLSLFLKIKEAGKMLKLMNSLFVWPKSAPPLVELPPNPE